MLLAADSTLVHKGACRQGHEIFEPRSFHIPRSNLRNFSKTPYRRSCSSSRRRPAKTELFSDPWSFGLPLRGTYETVQAPPATVFLHDRQFQIPTE